MKVVKILNGEYATFRDGVIKYIIRRILRHHLVILDPMAGTAPLIPFIETNGHVAYFNDILPVYFFTNKAKQYRIFQCYIKFGNEWFFRELSYCMASLKGKRLYMSEKWIHDEVLGGLVRAWQATEEYDRDIATFLKAVIIMCVRPFSCITRTTNPTWIKNGGASSNEGLEEIIRRNLTIFNKYYHDSYDSQRIKPRGRCIFSIREAAKLNLKRKVDFILTSPPYCNRLDCVRQFAPEDYFLSAVGYAIRECNNVIGTTKVSDYDTLEADFEYLTSRSKYLSILLNKIRKSPKADDPQYYLKYYTRYFSMLYQTFKKLPNNLSATGKMYVVLQDNSHRGELIETDRALRELLRTDGWQTRVVKKWERHHLGLRNASRDRAFVKRKQFEKLMVVWE